MKKLNNKKETYFIFDEDGIKGICKKLRVNEFSIGQSYDDEPAQKIQCKKCGSTEFIVGVGRYYTAIKCPKCKWETCIHSG